MLIQAFWYYTVTLQELQQISGVTMPRFVFLNWAQNKKPKTNKKPQNKRAKPKNHKQTNTKGNDNKKPTHTKNKQLFPYHLAHPV